MGASVIMENAYALAQHPSSPVLNRPPESYIALHLSDKNKVVNVLKH
jgi:hypothetical protein